MVPAAPRGPLTFDLDVDVCVIGGGLAGLTTARELARSGWSVVLLEAGRLAASASGRNTGFVLPGFAADAEKLIGRIGFERDSTFAGVIRDLRAAASRARLASREVAILRGICRRAEHALERGAGQAGEAREAQSEQGGG